MARFGEVIRAAARRDPTERALESDLLTRWPSGRRFMLTPYSVAGLLVVVGGIVAGPAIYALGALVGSALTAGVLLLCFGIVGWFLPIARVVPQHFDDVWWGTFVVISHDWSTVLTSPAIAVADVDVDVEFGSDRCVATKDGKVYFRRDNGTLPVVRLLDPFRRFRAKAIERELPVATRHLRFLLQAVLDHTTFEGRTHRVSAERSVVIDTLRAAGVEEPAELDAVIRLAREFGLLERSVRSRRSLSVSDAGRIWLEVELGLLQAAEGIPVEEELRAEVHDVATEMLAEGGYRSETMTPDRFREWTGSLIDSFKQVVETTAACDALWTRSGDPQDERAVQGFAHGVFHAYCEVADVDMSKEVDAGDGPVDFKFSQGWSSRALIEIKLLSNSRLSHGALSQLPAYLNAEGVSCGFYLCIGFTDADLAEKRKARVIVDCAAASERTGYEITPIFVDARRRPPASRRPG